jgi:hypothetical protein
VGVELRERYGDSSLTDEQVAAKAREEMVGKMQIQLKDDGVDVTDVTGIMEEMSRRNRDLFKLPSYVLYLSRAFSTLEGIGLTINEDYSILQECYPYLARRLFSDSSPRAKDALRTMLFSQTSSLSPGKLLEMSKGFNSYTSAVVNTDRDVTGMREAEEAFVDLLLAREGNALQDILIEEATRVTDALMREGVDRSLKSVGGKVLSFAVRLPVRTAKAMLPKPIINLMQPLQVPYLLSKGAVQFAKKSEEDEVILSTLRSLVGMSGVSVEEVTGQRSTEDAKLDGLVNSVRGQLLDSDSLLRRSLRDPQLRKRAPLLSLLTRKYGASLLTRLAERIDQTTGMASGTLPISSSPALMRRGNSSIVDRIGFFGAKSARTVSDVIKPKSGESPR